MLSQRKFEKATEFINTKARKLERELFRYEFEEKSVNHVINEMLNFQNEDGGFGNGIEPDIQMPYSSVYTTTVGFQYIDSIEIDQNHPIIEKGIQFLLNQIQEFGTKTVSLSYYWNPTDLNINKFHHAPWWSKHELEPPSLQQWSNPSVEVIGYLNRYKQFTPSELLDDLNNDLLTFLKNHKSLDGSIYYNFLCWKRTLPHVPKLIQTEIFELLANTVEQNDFLDSHEFEKMKIQWFVTEPSSFLNVKYPEKIKLLLQNEISRMHSDGSWKPTWKWGNENMWNKIELEWSGKITFDLLSTLKYFGLIEGIYERSI